jgi:hypothetical protein
MCAAVVRQQQFDGRPGQCDRERAFDHVDDLGFAAGHVEGVRQPAFEFLPRGLILLPTGLLLLLAGLLARDVDRFGQLPGQSADQAVGLGLLLASCQGRPNGDCRPISRRTPAISAQRAAPAATASATATTAMNRQTEIPDAPSVNTQRYRLVRSCAAIQSETVIGTAS